MMMQFHTQQGKGKVGETEFSFMGTDNPVGSESITISLLLLAEGLDWVITSNRSWLTVSPDTGSGTTGGINAHVTENTSTTTDRTGILTATSGFRTATFVIIQKASIEFRFEPKGIGTLSSAANREMFLFAENQTWQITEIDEGLTVNQSNGTGNSVGLRVYWTANTDTENRLVRYVTATSNLGKVATFFVDQNKSS